MRVALVLGAGGATGHAFHAGVLSALAERTGWDPRTADLIVGTSAGSGVGAILRVGLRAPIGLEREAPPAFVAPDVAAALAGAAADAEHRRSPHVETAPGLDHLCFRARSREDVDAVHAFLVQIGADIVRAPEEGPWAPGYYSCSFRDPEGIRLEVNHVPGAGLLAEGSSFVPAG